MQHQPALTDVAPCTVPGLEVEHRFVDVGDVTLHVAFAGPVGGPPVILLHGFPEAWFGWHHQIRALAAAGFRVVVPDQRGYNLSEKPAGIANYRIDVLAQDIVGLADALGFDAWSVAGHDWGAAVAWQLAFTEPRGLQRVAVLNVPAPQVMQAHVRRPKQAMRSWYMLAFQVPVLVEVWLTRANGMGLAKTIAKDARPGTFDDHLDRYAASYLRPGAMSGMLAWYRAAVRLPPPELPRDRVRIPMRILWGMGDPHLGSEMVDPSAEHCEYVAVDRYDDASHWVQHEAADRVNAVLIEHFGAVAT